MPDLNERFILAEDEALRRKFQGLSVTYPRPRAVDVWFRWPNKEVREVTHPFISIDLVDLLKADRREHSGMPYELDYAPVGFDAAAVDPSTDALVADEWPTPYDLIYSITVATLDPRHDRELKHKILGDRNRLPHRFAFLEIPEDQTIRRLDIIDVTSTSGRTGDNATEFYTIFTVRVESELFPGEVEEKLRAINGVNLIGITETTSGLREEYSV